MQTVVFYQLYGGRSCFLLSPTDVKKNKTKQQQQQQQQQQLNPSAKSFVCFAWSFVYWRCWLGYLDMALRMTFQIKPEVPCFTLISLLKRWYRFSCPNEIVYLLPKGFKSWPVIMRRLTSASLPVRLIPGDDALFIISPLTQGWGLCLSLTDL